MTTDYMNSMTNREQKLAEIDGYQIYINGKLIHTGDLRSSIVDAPHKLAANKCYFDNFTGFDSDALYQKALADMTYSTDQAWCIDINRKAFFELTPELSLL